MFTFNHEIAQFGQKSKNKQKKDMIIQFDYMWVPEKF